MSLLRLLFTLHERFAEKIRIKRKEELFQFLEKFNFTLKSMRV